MKRVLYGSTALVAASLLAGQAQAAEGVKLGVGGFYHGAAGAAIGEDWDNNFIEDNTRSHAFKQSIEIYFSGETTLDIGLTVGARVELEGQTAGDQIDAAFAYISGGFGELRFGDFSEAVSLNCYNAPGDTGNFGADSPSFNFANNGLGGHMTATNGTCWGLDGKSTKIGYFSPSFGGFSLSATYTPDGTEDTNNTVDSASTRFDNNFSQMSDSFSIAGNFSHDFNGFNLVAGGGAAFGKYEDDFNHPVENSDNTAYYNAYAQVAFSGFTVGAAYGARDNYGHSDTTYLGYGDTNLDYWTVAVGGSYTFDAWTVGFNWSRGEYDMGAQIVTATYLYASVTDAHFVTHSETGYNLQGTDTLNVYQITGAYALGPGISIDGMVGYDKYHDDNPEVLYASSGGSNVLSYDTGDYSAWEIGLGLNIGF